MFNSGRCDECKRHSTERVPVQGRQLCPECASVDYHKITALRFKAALVREGRPELVGVG